MDSNEKFCLKWNDFESNISSSFKEIREEKDFMDVTLACDDDQINAHKVVLSACSPFFRTILRRNPHQHPLLYMKGIKYSNLESLLNFMYYGEVNIAQEELNSFLAVAEELKVKGLTQNQSQNSSQNQKSNNPAPKMMTPTPSKTMPGSRPRVRTKQDPEPDDVIIEETPVPNVKTEPPSVTDHPVASYEDEEYQDYQDPGYEDDGGQAMAAYSTQPAASNVEFESGKGETIFLLKTLHWQHFCS